MKIDDLVEMTQLVPSYEHMKTWLPEFQKLLKNGIHCGDIEQFNIYKLQRDNLTDYGFFENDICVGFAVLRQNEITNVYIIPEKRQLGLWSMFLFFLKKNEHMSKIILDNRHSEQMLQALKRIYQVFDTSWIKGDEKIPFDPKTTDQFYSKKEPTGWKIMLENDGDFSKEENIFEGLNITDSRSMYFWFLEEEK